MFSRQLRQLRKGLIRRLMPRQSFDEIATAVWRDALLRWLRKHPGATEAEKVAARSAIICALEEMPTVGQVVGDL